MALIKPKNKHRKIQTRISLDEGLLVNIKAYCDWAKIEKIDDFIEQAIELVFAKDKDWKATQKQRQPSQ